MGDVRRASIIVNSYNYARYVGQAIESALGQTYPNTEVVVVDDGSTDGSRAVLAGTASSPPTPMISLPVISKTKQKGA